MAVQRHVVVGPLDGLDVGVVGDAQQLVEIDEAVVVLCDGEAGARRRGARGGARASRGTRPSGRGEAIEAIIAATRRRTTPPANDEARARDLQIRRRGDARIAMAREATRVAPRLDDAAGREELHRRGVARRFASPRA